MARRALTGALVARALLLAAASGCARDGEPAPAPRFADAEVTRVALDAAGVEYRSRWQPFSAEPAEQGLAPRFARDFEREVEPLSYAPPSALGRERPPPEPARDAAAAARGEQGVRFPTPEGSLVWWLPARPSTRYVVSAAVRRGLVPPPRAGESIDAAELRALVGRILVVELERPPTVTRVSGQPLAALEGLFGPPLHEHRSPPPPAAGEFATPRVELTTSPLTTSFVVILSAGTAGWWREDLATPPPPPPGAVDFDELAVFELPLARALVTRTLAPPSPPPAAAWRRALPLAGELRPALLAPPPSELRIPLELPRGPFRLRFAFGVADERRESAGVEPIRFFARLETRSGQVELPIERPIVRLADGAEHAGWHECRYDGDGEGGPAVLTLATSVESGRPCEDLALFSEPQLVVGSDRPRRSVLLVSLDTLRADRLGCYGYRRADGRRTSPRLDALATESVVFTNARALAPYTLPSHATLLTGMHPTVHGIETYESSARPDVHPFLARRFAESGWHAAAFTGGGFLAAAHGLWHGFDRWSELDPMLPDGDPIRRERPRRGDLDWNRAAARRCDVPAVAAWLRERRDEPFLAFVHTYVVHNFRLPPEQLAPFLSRPPRHTFRPIVDHDERTPTAAELAELSEIYDAVIAEADRRVGELIDALRESGLLDRTIVIVTSDHGEELGDHGGFGHGRTLHEEVLRVPLLVRVPGLGPRREDAPVTLADLAPTLLSLCGLAPLEHGCGRVVLPDVEDPVEPFTAALADPRAGTQRALLLNDRKLIEVERCSPVRPPLPVASLYDLAADPAERADLLRRAPDGSPLRGELQPPELRVLVERLATLFARLRQQRAQLGVDEGAVPVVNPDLDALGYTRGK